MAYESKKDKIIDWIEKGLIPKLPERDFVYNDIISGIAFECGTNEKSVEDVIQIFIKTGKIKHENLLVATDEQMKAYWEKQKALKEEADKVVGNVIAGVRVTEIEEKKEEKMDGKE